MLTLLTWNFSAWRFCKGLCFWCEEENTAAHTHTAQHAVCDFSNQSSNLNIHKWPNCCQLGSECFKQGILVVEWCISMKLKDLQEKGLKKWPSISVKYSISQTPPLVVSSKSVTMTSCFYSKTSWWSSRNTYYKTISCKTRGLSYRQLISEVLWARKCFPLSLISGHFWFSKYPWDTFTI